MITSLDQARNIQFRRYNQGLKGVAKAVRRFMLRMYNKTKNDIYAPWTNYSALWDHDLFHDEDGLDYDEHAKTGIYRERRFWTRKQNFENCRDFEQTIKDETKIGIVRRQRSRYGVHWGN